MSEQLDIEFGPCCFCNEQITKTETDPCRVTVETVHGQWQVWFTHAKCFRERLVRRDDGFFDPVHL